MLLDVSNNPILIHQSSSFSAYPSLHPHQASNSIVHQHCFFFKHNSPYIHWMELHDKWFQLYQHTSSNTVHKSNYKFCWKNMFLTLLLMRYNVNSFILLKQLLSQSYFLAKYQILKRQEFLQYPLLILYLASSYPIQYVYCQIQVWFLNIH